MCQSVFIPDPASGLVRRSRPELVRHLVHLRLLGTTHPHSRLKTVLPAPFGVGLVVLLFLVWQSSGDLDVSVASWQVAVLLMTCCQLQLLDLTLMLP